MLVFICIGSSKSAELTSSEVISATKASLEAVRSVECTFRMYIKDTGIEGSEFGNEGRALFKEYDWGWDGESGKGYAYGRFAFDVEEKRRYQTQVVVCDGHVVKLFTPESQTGRVSTEVEVMSSVQTPFLLLGKPFNDVPAQSIGDLLEGTELSSDPDAPAGLLVLRKTQELGGRESLGIKLWVDSARGFTVVLAETTRLRTRTRSRLVAIDDLLETSPGIWFPVRGYMTSYAAITPERFADGKTPAEMNGLPPDVVDDIVSRTTFDVRPNGMGTYWFIVEPKTLRINQPLNQEKVEFTFPPGSNYFDEVLNKAIDVPRPKELPRSSAWFLVLNVVVILGIFGLLLYRRHQRTATLRTANP